jgi:integrase/recombinase XerD
MLDIHNYEEKYAGAQRQVTNSTLSERNKQLIFGYRDACLIRNVCGKVRLIRVLGVLTLFGRLQPKDFDQYTKADVEHLIGQLVARQPPYTPETLGTYKAMLRNFLTWVLVPDKFPTRTEIPAQVAWIKVHVPAKDKRRLERNELLTPEDIQRLLDVCHNTRDKALIAVLWETGCRIAELGNLQLEHVTKTDHGYLLDLYGKTGHRTVLIISSAPYLTQWINNHPFKNRPDSPLWAHYQFATTPRQLQYDSIRYLLCRYFVRASIRKPFHPHIFRHSRATYVLANGIMNEPQAKTYFGWTPNSDMLATYSHLTSGDANAAVLRENNLAVKEETTDELRPTSCEICNEINQPGNDYCNKCGAVLNLKKAYEHQTAHRLREDVLLHLFKVLVEKGLLDDAAKQLHDAGLGETLKRLATHAEVPVPAPATATQSPVVKQDQEVIAPNPS